MGLNRLGSFQIINSAVFNTRGSESFSDNDIIVCYYNDSNNSIRVYLNPTNPSSSSDPSGTIITAGNPIFKSDVDSGVVRAKSVRYSFCEGSTLVKYYEEGDKFWDEDFPYFSRRTETNSPSCPVDPEPSAIIACDLEPIQVSTTNASTISATDGTIKVSVKTSDPNGVEVSLESFTYGNGKQLTRGVLDINGLYTYTGNITGLANGTYTVYVKDSRECPYRFTSVTVDYDSSYGERAYFYFDDKKENEYKFSIKKKDYTLTPTETLKLGKSPVNIQVGGVDNRGAFNSIYGTSMTATIKSMTNNQYTELFFGSDDSPVSDKVFIGELYRDPNGDNELMHRGYFLAEEYSEPYTDAPYDINLYFTDGLSDLSSEIFKSYNATNSAFDLIVECLKKTTLQNGIRIVSTSYPSDYYDASGNLSVSSGFSQFHAVYVNRSAYKGLTYRDVLDAIVGAANKLSHIISYGGYYYILPTKRTESSYTYMQYDYEGNYESTGTISLPINNGGTDSSGSVFLNSSQSLTRDAVYKNIGVVEDRFIVSSIFPSFTTDNIIGDKVSEDILGDGFYGYNTINNGDTGNWQVKKVVERGTRDVSNQIIRYTEEFTANIPVDVYGNVIRSRFLSSTTNFEQRSFFRNKVLKSALTGTIVKTESNDLFLNFNIPDGQNGDAYVLTEKFIESSKNDSFVFSFNYFINFNDANKQYSIGAVNIKSAGAPIPYAKVRYAIIIEDSIGTKNYLNGIDWDTEEVINELFVDKAEFNKIGSFSVQGTMPFNDNNCTLTCVIYDCDPYYHELSGDPSTVLATVDAGVLPLGYRQIVKSGDFILSYYELQDSSYATDSSATFVPATNNAGAVWVYTGGATLETLTTRVPNTEYAINNISFVTLPDGKEFDAQYSESKKGNDDNVYDFEYPVYHFDLRGAQANERGMILNYWQDASGNPIDGWGSSNTIGQDLILDELVAHYKSPKRKINMTLEYFSEINATNVLRITYDSNRLFKFNTFSQDVKYRTISGEIVEIGIDGQVISTGAFSDAFSDAFDN